MNVAFSIVLLFILLDCMTNEKPPCAKGCHVPLTAFNRPVKALYTVMNVPLFDGLRSYENIGPRRKHVKIILIHFLL